MIRFKLFSNLHSYKIEYSFFFHKIKANKSKWSITHKNRIRWKMKEECDIYNNDIPKDS